MIAACRLPTEFDIPKYFAYGFLDGLRIGCGLFGSTAPL